MRARLLTAASIFLIFIQAMAGANIDSAYNAKKQLVGFKLDERGLNSEERQALHFLYAYAPLCDVTDYSQDFYIANVRQTLLTREQMPWGKTIPSDIFMHFVLPLRVNNEPLDSARLVFYKQLKDRVKGLSMKDAILEVNHWCHEHVTYQPKREDGYRALRRGEHAHRCGTARSGHSGTASLHPALGPHRRQPCLGRGLGRRQVVVYGRLRARGRAQPGVVQRPGIAGTAHAHTRLWRL